MAYTRGVRVDGPESGGDACPLRFASFAPWAVKGCSGEAEFSVTLSLKEES